MVRFIAALALVAVPFSVAQEVPRPPDPLYEKREVHGRNGIGKFFMGREIAHVMGHQAAGWLERPEREQEERTDLLLEALNLKPGENVADIGCGTGYFAERMARKIEPGGVVYGVDIQQEMLDLMQRKLRLKQIKNVKSVLGAEADPKLEPESCDLMIMIDVYHEFEFPYEMIRKMIAGLKKGGRIVFVEYRAEDPNVPIKEVHKMSEAQVKKEMAIHPEMEFVQTRRELPQQHIIIFRKK
ncbi:MAG: hypothetical protein RL088_2520 [Verrucomicrobiota bacterium]|jgi:cyclopropane fatty-acyl-phospholipid synthase-like methyltransferase